MTVDPREGPRPGAPAAPPFADLVVLDLSTGIAGPYCTKLLAGFGARVVKVEAPGAGDPTRAGGPFAGGRESAERSLPFLWLNAGKESVTLALERPEGRAIADRLVAAAHVVVESFAPGQLDRLGLGSERIRAINPRAVLTSISNFGSSGPYRDYAATEATLYAMSGGMVATGDPDRAPLAPGPAITQYTAGMHAYLGTLLALYRAGDAERVEVAAQESALDNVEIALAEHLHHGSSARRSGDAHAMVPWQAHPCRDGQAAIIGGPIRRWLAAAPMFEEPRLMEEPFRGMGGRIKNRKDFEALLKPWLARHDKADVYRMGQERGLAFGYLATLAEAFASPQHRARGFFKPVEPHPEVGAQVHAGPPFTLGAGTWRAGRAPLLGEHTDAVLREMAGASDADLARWRETGVI